MFKRVSLTIVHLLLATSLVAAQPACLPKSVYTKNNYAEFPVEFPVIDLGYVGDTLTICAYERAHTPEVDKLLGCWTVNATTGALGASAAKFIPGRGRRIALDANNCFDGYCIAPIREFAGILRTFFGTSTDGAHAAILTHEILYVFATSTKAKVAEIELRKPYAPDETNIGNEPWDLLYSGHTLFVLGADAGPFIGAWVFKEDGTRAGRVTTDAGHNGQPLNVFNGGYGILGRDKVALADAGLQNMTIVTGANTAKQNTKRTNSHAPCTKDQFEEWTESGDNQTGACKRTLDTKYKPYVNMSPVQLPSGDIITTLSGPAHGYIAVLRPADLTERYRLKLARCP